MAYEELRQRQSVMWGDGPYQRGTETLTDIHEGVVERLAPEPRDRQLDLAPVLIDTARERAAELGLEIEYVVGDAERLELPDASFDKVSSTCKIMFAPDHEAVARELSSRHGTRWADPPRQLDARRRPDVHSPDGLD